MPPNSKYLPGPGTGSQAAVATWLRWLPGPETESDRNLPDATPQDRAKGRVPRCITLARGYVSTDVAR